jgi:hypothetical protein
MQGAGKPRRPMNFADSIDYPIEDERWLYKVVIGGVCFFTGWLLIPAFLFLGYLLEIVRHTMEGEVRSLPEWTDLSKKLKEGAGLFVAIMVYALPGWACLTGAFLCLSYLNGAISYVLFAILLIFGLAFGWLYLLLMFPMWIEMARTGTIKAAFRPHRLLRISMTHFLVYLRLLVAAGFFWVMGYAGYILCVIGALFTIPWFMYAMANAVGVFGRGTSLLQAGEDENEVDAGG